MHRSQSGRILQYVRSKYSGGAIDSYNFMGSIGVQPRLAMGGRVIQAPLSIFCTVNHKLNILNGVRMNLPTVASSQQGQLLVPSRYAL